MTKEEFLRGFVVANQSTGEWTWEEDVEDWDNRYAIEVARIYDFSGDAEINGGQSWFIWTMHLSQKSWFNPCTWTTFWEKEYYTRSFNN